MLNDEDVAKKTIDILEACLRVTDTLRARLDAHVESLEARFETALVANNALAVRDAMRDLEHAALFRQCIYLNRKEEVVVPDDELEQRIALFAKTRREFLESLPW